jgi:hypothetical protein
MRLGLALAVRLERLLLVTLSVYCAFELSLDLLWSNTAGEAGAHLVGKGLWFALIGGALFHKKLASTLLGFLCAVNVIVATLTILFPSTDQRPPIVLTILLINLTIKGLVFTYYVFVKVKADQVGEQQVISA